MKREVRIQNQFTHEPDPGEKIPKRTIVDPSGYVDPKTRIENLMRAGERLDEYRREMYQYGADDDPEDDSSDDPTRSPGFDLADASYLQRKAIARLRRSKEASEGAGESTEPKQPEAKPAKATEAKASSEPATKEEV